MKHKLEAITVNEGEEFEMAEGEHILHSELIDSSGHWGLVVVRRAEAD